MLGKKWKLALAAGMAAAALIAAGCGGSGSDSKAAADKGGIIRVGAETTYPPFEFTQDDKYVGFDLDLSDAVIKQMGGKMEFKSMGFDALIPALQSNQIDLVASGMDVTPEREKQVAFSDIYFDKSGKVIIVLKDNDQIHDWDDLKGRVVCGQVGTKQVEFARLRFRHEERQQGTAGESEQSAERGPRKRHVRPDLRKVVRRVEIIRQTAKGPGETGPFLRARCGAFPDLSEKMKKNMALLKRFYIM